MITRDITKRQLEATVDGIKAAWHHDQLGPSTIRADVWGGRGSYSCVDLHVDQPESYRIELVLRAPDATHGAFPDVSYACADRDAMMEFLHGLGCALLAITEVENRI